MTCGNLGEKRQSCWYFQTLEETSPHSELGINTPYPRVINRGDNSRSHLGKNGTDWYGWTDFLGDPHQVDTELRSALTGAAKRLLPDVEVRTSKEWGMMATQHAPKVGINGRGNTRLYPAEESRQNRIRRML